MNNQFDVVIIGGGVIGLCSAYSLASQGARIAVLDKGDMNDGASFVNAGLLVPSHIETLAAPGVITQGLKWLADPESPFYIKPRIDMDLTRWLWGFQSACTHEHVARSIPLLRDMALDSLERYRKMATEAGIKSAAPNERGLLMLHNSTASERANLELADAAESAGLDIERLTAEETTAMEPEVRTEVTGSVLFRQDALFDPEQFMSGLRAWLQMQNVTFFTGREVTGFISRNRRVTGVETSSGPLMAEHLVVAAGAWTGALAGRLDVRIPIQPGTGYSITVENPSCALRLPLILTDQKLTITPMPGRIRFGGTMTLVGFDSKIDERRTRPLKRLAHTYCPELSDERIPTVRSGFRPVTSDGLPALGKSSAWINVVFAAGHGMLGMTQGPTTGHLVADLINGNKSDLDITLLDPDRFP